MADAKTFEKHINENLSMMMYACLKDLEAASGDTRFSPILYQTYDNLLKGKDKLKGVKARFTISDPVRQFIRIMYYEAVKDLSAVQFAKGDNTEAAILDKIYSEHGADCFAAFMLSVDRSDKFGPTLRAYRDAWTAGKISGMLPMIECVPAAVITSKFDAFLKTIAWLLALSNWYAGSSINDKLLLATVAQQGLPDDLIGTLRDNLVVREPKPKKSAAKPAEQPTEESPKVEDLAAAIEAI